MFYVHPNPPSLRHTLQKMYVSKYRRESLKLSKKIFRNTIDIKLEGGTFLSKLHFWQKPNPRKKNPLGGPEYFSVPNFVFVYVRNVYCIKRGGGGEGPPAPPLLCEFQVFQLRRRGYCRPPPPAMLLKLYLFSLPMEKEMRWRNSIF